MVIGDSAILNQKDKICQFLISDNKVFEIICENTLMTAGVGAQLEEIKLQKFIFNRSGAKQITVVGGRFKDYLERSRINIVVPETGKIDFKEEELLVKDEFEPIIHTEVQGELQNGIPADDAKEKGR
jgi:topoisomerase IA-like protein